MPKGGRHVEAPAVRIVERYDIGNILEKNYDLYRYHLQGFWQNAYAYYLPNRETILGYFVEKATKETNKNDIVMHVRLGDYKRFGPRGTVLDPKYYWDCLAKEQYADVYILTDEPHDPYIEQFRRKNFIVRENTSERDDFWFMAGFDRIVCGNSSYSWWAAFLSNATRIYTPSCWIRNSNEMYRDLQNIQNAVIMPAGFKDYQ
jgi:hypothetical protein